MKRRLLIAFALMLTLASFFVAPVTSAEAGTLGYSFSGGDYDGVNGTISVDFKYMDTRTFSGKTSKTYNWEADGSISGLEGTFQVVVNSLYSGSGSKYHQATISFSGYDGSNRIQINGVLAGIGSPTVTLTSSATGWVEDATKVTISDYYYMEVENESPDSSGAITVELY